LPYVAKYGSPTPADPMPGPDDSTGFAVAGKVAGPGSGAAVWLGFGTREQADRRSRIPPNNGNRRIRQSYLDPDNEPATYPQPLRQGIAPRSRGAYGLVRTVLLSELLSEKPEKTA
jgi:hypothetical protein